MFALAIALLALAVGDALFGVSGAQATLLLIACFAASILAMIAYWRNHEEH